LRLSLRQPTDFSLTIWPAYDYASASTIALRTTNFNKSNSARCD
jgi:hypothetical protein